jgi:hypothetical protein
MTYKIKIGYFHKISEKKVLFGSGGLFSKKDILKMSKNQKGLLKWKSFFLKK